MKKLILIFFLSLLFSGSSEAETKKQEENLFAELEALHKAKNGFKKKNTDGTTLYYSEKHGDFLSCREFNKEGLVIDKEYSSLGLSGATPICHGTQMWIIKDGKRLDATFNEFRGEFIINKNLRNILALNPSLNFIPIFILIVFGGMYYYRKETTIFLAKINNNIKLYFSKIKKNKIRIFASLTVFYLCFMLWLNWLGHQSHFIYKVTYTWFIGWGVVPAVALWSLYFIWKKNN